MPPAISLDVHTHLIPIEAAHLNRLPGVIWDASAERLSLDGTAIGLRALFHPEALIEWMDHNNVRRAWISLPPLAYRQQLHRDAAEQWTDYVNQGLRNIASRYPNRLEPLLHLNIEHPNLAAQVAERENAQRFAVAAGGEPERCFSDAQLEPLWSVLNGLAAFVFLHPARCCDKRLQHYYLDNLLGNPYETGVAVSHLIFGGVIERFPEIRFCLAHGGGVVPALLGRWQRGFDTVRTGIDTTLAPPVVVARRLLVDCLMHDSQAVGLAAEVFGSGNVLFGSDWPFPMGLIQPHAQLAGLPDSLRASIFAISPDDASGRTEHPAA